MDKKKNRAPVPSGRIGSCGRATQSVYHRVCSLSSRAVLALLITGTCAIPREGLPEVLVPATVARMRISTVDDDATGYGTFQSHNQKVVSTSYGIFMTYVKTAPFAEEIPTWRLLRSQDCGDTFQPIWEGTDRTYAPALEATADGTLYLAHGDEATNAAHFYRLSPLTEFVPEPLATVDEAHAQKFSLLLDEARGNLYYLAYLGPNIHDRHLRFVRLDMNGAVTADYLLTGGEMTAKPTYPRMVLSDGILYVAWSSDKIDGDNNDYYSIHGVRSPDGGVTWQSLSGTPLIPPFEGDQGGDTTEVTHPVERPCSTWLAGFAVTRGKAHFLYKNDSNDNLPCSLKRTMRYQRFNVAGGAREADVTGFAPANVPFDSRDGFFAISARAGSLLATGRTKDNRIATVASTNDGNTWSLKSQSAPLMDNIYAIGGQRDVTAEGMVFGSYTHDGSPAAVRFLKASVLKNSIPPTGTPLAATLSANAEAVGYPIQNAADADDATVWVANLTPTGTNNNAWVQLDLGATKYVSRLRFTTAYAPYPAHGPADYTVQASIDGTTWRPVAGVSVPNGYAGHGDYMVDGAARYLKLTTTKINDGTGWALGLTEIWAEGSTYPAHGATPLVATMSANAAAAGYPTTSGTDANTATQWVASLEPTAANNDAWALLDLGTVKRVRRLRWQGASGLPYPAGSPADYVVETSIDGWNYTRAISRTNAVGVIDGDELVDRNARFIRLTTTKVNDGTGWSLSFHELWAE